MDRLQLKNYLGIPEEDRFVEGDTIAEVTRGITTSGFSHQDANGNIIAFYKVVTTTDLKGGGSITWKRTLAGDKPT